MIAKINNDKMQSRRKGFQSLFFIIFIAIGFVTSIVSMILYYQEFISTTVYTNIILAYLFVFAISGIILFPYEYMHFGLNLNKLKWNLKWGLPIGFVLLEIMEIGRYFLVKSGKTEFAFKPVPSIHIIYYPLIAFLQELVTRGYLQTYFIVLFEKMKNTKHFAILLSSLIFAVLHLVYGFKVFLVMFVFSTSMGYFYEKSQSVVGVTIIHIIAGISMFFSESIGMRI